MTNTSTSPKSRRRRWLLLGLLALLAIAILELPRALSSRSGRNWLLGKANRVLAPGRFEVETLEFSWFSPTRMTGFVLLDAQRDRVVFAPTATWDRKLHQVLFQRPRLGTLRLENAVLDIERRPDGTIDLYEALKPILGLNPKTALRIEAPDGRLRLRGKGLAEPVAARHAAIALEITPVPGPVGWSVRLANGSTEFPTNGLDIDGSLQRGSSDMEIRVSARQWPWALGDRKIAVSGKLDGNIQARKTAGRWQSTGDATLGQIQATGRWLSGESVRVEQAQGVWDLAESEAGWSVRRFELTSPLATLKGDGTGPASDGLGGNARLNGRVDLAALAAQLPRTLRLREGVVLDRGTAEVRVESSRVEGIPLLDLTAKVSDFRGNDHGRSFTLRDPATLTARLKRPAGAIEVERFTAETPYLKGEARGDLARGLTVSGSLDLAGLQRQLRDLVDFGTVELAGLGSLTGEYRAEGGRFRGRLKGDLRGLRLAGAAGTFARVLKRDAVGLALDLDGPAAESGLPAGLGKLSSRLTSGNDSADLTVSVEGPRALMVFSAPVAVPDIPARAEGKLEARWDAQTVIFDPVVLSLVPVDPKKGPPALRITAKGQLNRATGEIVLHPEPYQGSDSAIALTPYGLHVFGEDSEMDLLVGCGLTGDLARLAPWLRSAPEGLRGRWSASASIVSHKKWFQVGLGVDGLAWGPGQNGGVTGEPLNLYGSVSVLPGGKRLDLGEFTLSNRYVMVEATGKVDDSAGQRLADVTGRIAPNWDEINRWLAANVEPGARVSGRSRPLRIKLPDGTGWRPVTFEDAVPTAGTLHVKVPLVAAWRQGLDGELGVSLDGADLYGLKLGPTAVVLRAKQGALALDPIDATINEGRLHLEPTVRTGDGKDKEGLTLVLGPGSSLTDARVNDDVSRQVLSFVAPVLNSATRVRGRVSAKIEDASFPIGGRPGGGAKVNGAIVFNDVEFVPGPMTEQLFTLFGRENTPIWRLNDPVSLTISDRRVYQHGLTIPIGKLSRVELDGWVDFDRNINLTASVPVLPSMLADRPVLEGIAGTTKIKVPIRGTLQKPEIDRKAFDLALKDMGRSLLEGAVTEGAAALFQRLMQGRDPNLPPPPPRLTPEKRRTRAQEKRDERRRKRGLEP
jgi:translocation and assembly module TamB